MDNVISTGQSGNNTYHYKIDGGGYQWGVSMDFSSNEYGQVLKKLQTTVSITSTMDLGTFFVEPVTDTSRAKLHSVTVDWIDLSVYSIKINGNLIDFDQNRYGILHVIEVLNEREPLLSFSYQTHSQNLVIRWLDNTSYSKVVIDGTINVIIGNLERDISMNGMVVLDISHLLQRDSYLLLANPLDRINGRSEVGSVAIYHKQIDGWNFQQRLIDTTDTSGNLFGYNDLIVDFTGLEKMKKYKIPIVLDSSHSTQKTNQKKGITNGEPEFIETLSKAGIAVGVNGIFIETHFNPKEALSDSGSMLDIKKMKKLLKKLLKIQKSIN